MIMDTVQIRKASVPVVPAMPPIENRTSAGTPLATQKAPRQSICLSSLLSAGCSRAVLIVLMSVTSPFPVFPAGDASALRSLLPGT